MNAITDTLPQRRPVAAPHATHKFKLLLRREFWEHKGGFFWAPLIAGGIALLFTVLASVGLTIAKRRSGNDFEVSVDDPERIAKLLGGVGDGALFGGIALALVVLGFVVFFYALGCLYDDRKDRSVLFWKSLPVSDAGTVGSKLAWALGLAPMLAVAIGIAFGIAFWVVAALTTTVNGVPGASGVFMHSHPFRVIGNVLAMIPLYTLWALPAVGWLMLCSAAARTKPFLWAVMIPVLGCALVSFANVVLGLGYDVGPLWYAVAYRSLLSVFPATWLPRLDSVSADRVQEPNDLSLLVNAADNWALAGSADLWIGVVVGVLMILAAVRLRRWRDEG
jgi:ABC-2 type transport system permease protein